MKDRGELGEGQGEDWTVKNMEKCRMRQWEGGKKYRAAVWKWNTSEGRTKYGGNINEAAASRYNRRGPEGNCAAY